MGMNDMFGWVLKDQPTFWEDNGFKIVRYSNHFNCEIADANKYPVYRKTLAKSSDYEDYCMVEVHSCDIGVIKHAYMVYLHSYNNAGYTGYSLRAALQCTSIREYNQFIKENHFDIMEDGETFLLNKAKIDKDFQ